MKTERKVSVHDVASAAPIRIKPSRLKEQNFGWLNHEVTLPSETPSADILTGEFWRPVSHRLHRGDRIRYATDDLMRFGELVVVQHDPATSRTEIRELWSKEVDPVTVEQTERQGFRAVDLGLHGGWAIIREADGQQVAQNLASFDEAQRRIKIEHLPDLARHAEQMARRAG